MKILIVSTFFPPLNSIASLRPYSWAKRWSDAGHQVTVLTTQKWPQPSDSPMPIGNLRVHAVSIPGASWMLRVLGMVSKSQDTPAPSESLNVGGASRPPNPLYRLLDGLRRRYGIMYTCRMPDYHDGWAWKAYSAVSKENWDAVISCSGPYSTHWIGYRLRRNGKTKLWIADWRDLWTNNHIFPGLPGFRWIERLIERKFCTTADHLTTVSPGLADTLRAKYGNKISVIYNGSDPDELTRLPPQRAYPSDGILRIVHTGTIYHNHQDPAPLFRAVRQLHERGVLAPDRLNLIFAGSRGDPRELARTLGVEAYVRYLGFLPRPEALRLQRDANVLLFFEFESDNYQGILTGKIFEYLFSGPPILALGTPTEASALIKDTGRGWPLGQNVNAIVRWLEAALTGTLPPLPVAVKPISQYQRKTQAEALLALMESPNLR